MSELAQYIKSYFGVVQEKELETIVALFKKTTLQKGDYFLKTGKPSNHLSFIQSGLMRIFVSNEEKEITQWICTKGYFITDLSSFIFQTPARWNIQALTNVELFTISREDYNKIGQLIPAWHQLEKLFIARCFTMLEDRIFSHLSMSAEERYQFFFQHNKELFNQVPLQYIASMLGMTPETFSRIRKKSIS
ncbi:MAG: Crp/Fnr family transcriptional regulator [Flavobacteriales bacterium]